MEPSANTVCNQINFCNPTNKPSEKTVYEFRFLSITIVIRPSNVYICMVPSTIKL